MTNTIGRNIKGVRVTLGYSQSSLARKLGSSQSALSQIEGGTRNPSFGFLLRIKRALKCEWGALLRGID